MKALLVSHSNGGGGAGRATQRVFDALDASGVDVRMYADFKHGDDLRVMTVHGPLAVHRRRLRIVTEEVPAYLASHPQRQLFSPGLTSAITARTIDASGADVVNLHWTGYGTISIAQIGRIATPTVWTLHDMWAFTGGLGYDDQDAGARWRAGYSRPNPRHTRFDVERWTAHRKARHWHRPIPLVTPSSWLADQARASALLHDWPVTVIPNPVDIDLFKPMDKRAARARLGIDHRARLVTTVLGSDLADPRKGFDLLLDAVARMPHTFDDDPVELAVVGHAHPPADWPHGLPRTHWLGRLDDAGMVAAYNAADVVVVPSRQDNLPQTATEPQACGVPVVASDIGGLPDAVEHELTGFLCAPGDPADLARRIEHVLTDPARAAEQGQAARARAIRRWAPRVVGDAYAQLFDEVALYR